MYTTYPGNAILDAQILNIEGLQRAILVEHLIECHDYNGFSFDNTFTAKRYFYCNKARLLGTDLSLHQERVFEKSG